MTKMIKAWLTQSFSVSLQLAGALILLLFGVSTNRDDIIRSLFSSTAYIERDGNTDEITDISIQYKEKYRNAFLNKIAFFLLSLGYGLSLFGSVKKDEQCCAFLWACIPTIVIVSFTKLLVEKFFLKQPDVLNTVKNSDLKRLGIEPHSETLSNKEVKKTWENVFRRKV